MGILTLFFLALGLAMDALAVSISNGMCYRGCSGRQAAAAAATFGIFQAVMPALGYAGGRMFSHAISSLDHWIALILLGAIGGNMVFEAVRSLGTEEESRGQKQRFSFRILLVQAVATSIDALAVGVSFALMQTNIALASVTIGVVTFVCCLLGGALGNRFGLLLGQRARLFGGLALMAIGLNIFVEHTISI